MPEAKKNSSSRRKKIGSDWIQWEQNLARKKWEVTELQHKSTSPPGSLDTLRETLTSSFFVVEV